MTAKIKMMIQRTKMRFEREGIVLAIMVRMSLRDFQDFASLNTLNNLNDLNMDRPLTPSNSNSTRDKATITKSKQFQPS